MKLYIAFVFSFIFIFQTHGMEPPDDGTGEPPRKRMRIERKEESAPTVPAGLYQSFKCTKEICSEEYMALLDEIEFINCNLDLFDSSSPEPGDESLPPSQVSQSASSPPEKAEDSTEEIGEESGSSISGEEKCERTSILRLSSLSAHRNFIREAFENARERIIFCSPFIHFKSGFDKDFTAERIQRALDNNVQVTFVVGCVGRDIDRLKRTFNVSNHPNFKIISKDNFHNKTAIVDNKIAEGSFNWLSACRDSRSRYHSHEATLVYEGLEAIEFIKGFLKLVGE